MPKKDEFDASGPRQRRILDVRHLKSIAYSLPKDHPLRVAMVVEEDEMEAEEFLAKVRTWLRLLPLEP